MLIYSNYLVLEGQDAYKGVFSSLAGWIKKKTGEKVRPSDFENKNNFEIENLRVSIEKTVSKEPFFYSVIIKHPDKDTRGRQWILELGLEICTNLTNISCVLKTEEISSLVTNEIKATRPLIIEYIQRNCTLSKDTPGLAIKSIKDDRYTYRGLQAEIERSERNYPIVLVSPTRGGLYLVDTHHLQNQLIGLAQVMVISPNSDTYEMEENLGKCYSAWDGAINVIYPPFRGRKIHNKLLRSRQVEEAGDQRKDRIGYILAIITHHTNIINLNRQIRPEGVRAKALREKYISMPDTSKVDKKYKKYIEDLWNIAIEQEIKSNQNIEKIELDNLQLKEQLDELEEKLFRANNKIQGLQSQLENSGKSNDYLDHRELFEFCCRSDEPSLEEALNLVKGSFPNSCTVLDSAIESARKAVSFNKGRRLLSMIDRLLSEYLPKYLDGGDNKARSVFTPKEYSATESETIISNKQLASCRKFLYKGSYVEMWQHLRIGVVDNPQYTIRVHFLIDKNDKKVVIGYCGEHLPISSY